MPIYNYTAINSSGKKVKGTIIGNTESDALNLLKEKKLHPININSKEDRNINFAIFDSLTKVTSKDLSVFCKQFQAMLNAGIPIISCLDIIRQQIEKKKFQKVVSDIFENLQKGLTFSEALKRHRNIFPEIMISMVEAGEISGNLDIIMLRLSEHFENEFKTENKIKTAMVYPIVLLVITVIVVIFLLVNVLPTFLSMFTSSGVELPFVTRLLLGISNFITGRWYLLIGIISVLFLLITRLIKEPEVRLRIDIMKLNIPILKGINQKIVTARFTRTMATLMGSGVDLISSLEIVGKVTGNKYIESIILKVIENVKKGISMSEPLKYYNIFPPMVASMIKIGEDSGAMEDVLNKTADFFDDELDNAIKKLTTLIEPIMIVIMAVVVGFIIIAMVMPMFHMISLY